MAGLATLAGAVVLAVSVPWEIWSAVVVAMFLLAQAAAWWKADRESDELRDELTEFRIEVEESLEEFRVEIEARHLYVEIRDENGNPHLLAHLYNLMVTNRSRRNAVNLQFELEVNFTLPPERATIGAEVGHRRLLKGELDRALCLPNPAHLDVGETRRRDLVLVEPYAGTRGSGEVVSFESTLRITDRQSGKKVSMSVPGRHAWPD